LLPLLLRCALNRVLGHFVDVDLCASMRT
jgi:hypothetical protein